MGKASRWFRSLFAAKKTTSPSPDSSKEKKKWGFVRGSSYAESSSGGYGEAADANKHAIAVAAATAAVAEAALAAAHAAAEVVRLTSGGGSASSGSNRPATAAYGGVSEQRRREVAAVKIQSAFRAYLDITTPKKYGKQFRAYSTKSDRSPLQKSSLSYMKIKGDIDLEKTHLSSNWLDRWMEEHPWSSHGDTSQKSRRTEDERIDKILEVDTWKPHPISKQGSKVFRAPFDPLPRHPTKPQKQNPSMSSGEVSYLTSLKFSAEVDQGSLWARENSPQMYSASSRPGSSGRRGPFTPARSECSKSLFGDYMGYPNYMANTESSWAKVRSQSAPRQRIMQLEKPASLMRFVRGYWDGDSVSERGLDLCEDFSTKAYPGSEMPVRGSSTTSYRSSYGGR